ncbi:hypothetical protein BD779DRAFT_1664765 [Infundibulicybe gibba]|nr:hypothetical protein BD779DRAFT_1664765 [Infundibulicybe gibba]
MHKLSRQLARPPILARVLRAPRPSGSRHILSQPCLRARHYSSSNAPAGPKDKFDRLFASLRRGMNQEELAMTIAALVMSTNNQNKLAKLESSIPGFMHGLSREALYKRVNHYLANPPKDNFDSMVPSDSADTTPEVSSLGESTTQGQSEEKKVVQTSEVNAAQAELPHGSPLGELIAQLQIPDSRRVLENLEPEERAEFRELMTKTLTESGNEDMAALNRIAQFLSYHGLSIRYTTRPAPAADVSQDLLAEFETLEKTAEGVAPQVTTSNISEAETPPTSSPETTEIIASNTSLSQMDPVALAKRTLEDESSNPLTVPQEEKNDPYPDLMTPDPLMDSRDVTEFPPDKESPYHNRVVVRNHSSMFHEALEADGFDFSSEDWKPITTDETEEQLTSTENLPLTPTELRNLYKFPILSRRITQQTGKGKIHRQFCLMIVGNGDGLVGYGQGKDEDGPRAEAKAFAQAVRNMDWVERFEKRTIWTDMETKLGATRLILRPRPVGFGLRCNPNLHQVLKAAGIKDISAKVWGSRNPINVIKAAFRMLQAGHAPLAMGDGLGGPGRKLNKGTGLRSKSDMERERGRKLISLRK